MVEARSGGLVAGVAADDLAIEPEHVSQDGGGAPGDHPDARAFAHVAHVEDDLSCRPEQLGQAGEDQPQVLFVRREAFVVPTTERGVRGLLRTRSKRGRAY